MCNNHAPLSVSSVCASFTSIPQPRAQPIAAFVGLPSPSNAALVAGPRFSTSLSCCLASSAFTCKPKRRGDAYQLTPWCANSNVSSSAVKFAAKASANLRSAFGGNSSVPISTNKFCADILTYPYTAGNQALRVCHSNFVHTLLITHVRVKYNVDVRLPKLRGVRLVS